MSYRESDYDPNAYPRYGPPLRPYNWVQWTGLGLMLLGIGLDLLYFTGRFGWTPAWVDSPALAMSPLVLGAVLINSRREVLEGEVRSTSRRTLTLIAVALFAFALALTAVLYFKGAS